MAPLAPGSWLGFYPQTAGWLRARGSGSCVRKQARRIQRDAGTGREQGVTLTVITRTYTTFRKKTCESVLASFDRHLHDRIETSLLIFLDESALWSVCWHLPRPQTRVCLVRAAHSIQTRGGVTSCDNLPHVSSVQWISTLIGVLYNIKCGLNIPPVGLRSQARACIYQNWEL